MNPKHFSQRGEGQKGTMAARGRRVDPKWPKPVTKHIFLSDLKTTFRKGFAQKCSYHRYGGLFLKECTGAGTYSLQSSICSSTQGHSLSPAQLRGRIWCHDLLFPLLAAAWRQGQGEEKTGRCHIATRSFDILCDCLCLAQVGRQSSSLIQHFQIIPLATEQSHDSFALTLPTIWTSLFLTNLFFKFYFSPYK